MLSFTQSVSDTNIYVFKGTLFLDKRDLIVLAAIGAVHKVRHARRGGGPRTCDSFWQGRGSRACDVTLI